MNWKTGFRTTAKATAFILFAGFVAIQFVPATRNQSSVVPETDLTRTFEMPDEVQTLLKNSCYDCHSNNTRYPWYNRIQPAAWFMEGHITEGKKELNFSEFGSYSIRRQKSKLKKIVSQVKAGEMPLPSYTWIHRDARLSDNEKRILEDWIEKTRNGL